MKSRPELTLEVQNTTGVLTVSGRELFSKFLNVVRMHKVEQWVTKPLGLLEHQHALTTILI